MGQRGHPKRSAAGPSWEKDTILSEKRKKENTTTGSRTQNLSLKPSRQIPFVESSGQDTSFLNLSSNSEQRIHTIRRSSPESFFFMSFFVPKNNILTLEVRNRREGRPEQHSISLFLKNAMHRIKAAPLRDCHMGGSHGRERPCCLCTGGRQAVSGE